VIAVTHVLLEASRSSATSSDHAVIAYGETVCY